MTTLALLSVLLAGSCGWAGAWFVRRHAEHLGLVQHPNHRSSHRVPTPSGGGIGIVVGVTLAGMLAWTGGLASARWVATLGLALPLALIGFIDDLRPVSARLRLALHILVCAALLALHGLWGALGPIGFLVLLLAGVWWVNLFNFMDGIDGIAGSQAAFMATAAGGLALVAGATTMALLPLAALAAASLGFLRLNWPPARVFLGDVGSTWLGFVLFALAVVSSANGLLHPAVWVVLAAVFGCDATITLVRRMLAGQRWTDAHRSHAYQRLSRRLGGHRSVTLIVIAVNVGWLLPLAALVQAAPAWAWPIAILACLPIAVAVMAAGAGLPD